jgi:LuxR family maltose regulon positive regulatory protein
MPRHEHHRTPMVMSGVLYTDDVATTGICVGSPAWFTWLTTATTFYFATPDAAFTAHHKRRRGGSYWIAYRRYAGVLRRVHLGKPDHLTLERLEQVDLTLATLTTDPQPQRR